MEKKGETKERGVWKGEERQKKKRWDRKKIFESTMKKKDVLKRNNGTVDRMEERRNLSELRNGRKWRG